MTIAICAISSSISLRRSYDVTRAYAGQDAIDSARNSTPDAVLLDLLLPDVSGIAVGRAALRDDERTLDVPIVIISGDRAALASRRSRSERTRSSRSRSASPRCDPPSAPPSGRTAGRLARPEPPQRRTSRRSDHAHRART
jgi:CheY-like chemotaxis protein